MFEDDFHDGKVISLFLLDKHLERNFKFHNDIDINNDILSKFPSFYQDILIKWINNYTSNHLFYPWSCLSSFVLTQMRRFIIILCIFLTKNFIGQFFNYNGNIKENMKIEYNLKNTHKMYWLKIIDTLPKKTWKYIILKYK